LWNTVEQRIRAAEGTVPLGRFSILRVVDRFEDGCRVQDIADSLLITVGAASRIVDRLVGDDLLTRSPHPHDRRSHHLTLSLRGRRSLAATSIAFGAALQDLLGGLSPHAIHALTTALEDADAHMASRED
jgi:DNA-binding MarR family transcriptional regulator